ncbi:MAG: hypothetical protein ACREM2_02975 [Vulcanimicrobiaceae bacterium]
MLRASLAKGTLLDAALPTGEFAERAEDISKRNTPRSGPRTLALVHVAAATMLDATLFLSYDERQRAVARREGLTVSPTLGRR